MVAARCLEEQPQPYDIPLTDKQKETLRHFLRALRSCGDLESPLEDFLFALCEQQASNLHLNIWSCPMQCYWAARALRDDGNFIQPDQFTGWLTKTKHLCIVTAALHAINHRSEYSNGLIG